MVAEVGPSRQNSSRRSMRVAVIALAAMVVVGGGTSAESRRVVQLDGLGGFRSADRGEDGVDAFLGIKCVRISSSSLTQLPTVIINIINQFFVHFI